MVDRLDRLDKGSLQAQFLRLAQQKGLLDAIFEAIQEGLVVLDREGCIQYANRRAQKMFGFSAETALGDPIQRYLKGLDWDLLMDLDEGEWRRMLRRELEVTYPDHRFVEFYVVPLGAVTENEDGAVLMLRDVTHERESAAKSIETERLQAITLLAAGVAHEIGNPLNSLNIHLQLMERELRYVEDDETSRNLRELLDISSKEVQRLDQIIHQFLRAIRPAELERSPVRMEKIVQETVDFMKREIEDRGIIVETEWDENMPAISVDETQVKQAFFNLIKNAMQELESDGIIRIGVTLTEKFVRVSFADNGPGISADSLGSLGQPYRTNKTGGSGLGLMIVQRIMRDHGGEMEIISQPGLGAEFVLFFPRDDVRIRLLELPVRKAEESAAV